MNEQAIFSDSIECTSCGIAKSPNDFYKNKNCKVQNWCKQCRCAYQNEWSARNKDFIKSRRRKEKEQYPQRVFLRNRKNNLKRNFNITLEDYEEMYRTQDGRCGICKSTQNRVDYRSGQQQSLLVDHSHQTGKIRGLLCSNCNSALGLLKEDTGIAQNLIEYINRYKER